MPLINEKRTVNNPNAEADKERKTDNCLFNWILHSSLLPLHLKRYSNKKRRTQKSGLNLAHFWVLRFLYFSSFNPTLQLDSSLIPLLSFHLPRHSDYSLFSFHFRKTFFTLRSSLFVLHSSFFTLRSSLFVLHSSFFTLHSEKFFTLHFSLKAPHPCPVLAGLASYLCLELA